MTTYEMVMELLATAGEDLSIDTRLNGDISVTVEDFDGFDEEWEEIERDYDEDLIDSIEDKLEELADSVDGDYYRYYHFDGFTVVWGHSSFDI